MLLLQVIQAALKIFGSFWFKKYAGLILNYFISDNVNLNIDGVLYLKITDPKKTSYGIEDPEFAISQLAQTTMRYV